MKRTLPGCSLGLATLVLMVNAATAHTPILAIEDNEDGTIYVEAGYSDGSSAAGIAISIEDTDGNMLWDGKLDEDGCLTIEKPEVVPYFVILHAGVGHVVKKKGPPPGFLLAHREPEDAPLLHDPANFCKHWL